MANYHVKFRVGYVGGTADEFDEVIPQEKFYYYSDGAQGGSRLNQMAEERDYKGRKVHHVTMSTISIEY